MLGLFCLFAIFACNVSAQWGQSNQPSYMTTYQQPSQTYQQPSQSSYQMPSQSYGAPSYQTPSQSYGAPSYQQSSQSSYQTPTQSYGAPSYQSSQSSYQKPSQSYGAPSYQSSQSSYQKPSQSYGAPSYQSSQSSYQTPSQSYGAPSYQSAQSSYQTPSQSYGVQTYPQQSYGKKTTDCRPKESTLYYLYFLENSYSVSGPALPYIPTVGSLLLDPNGGFIFLVQYTGANDTFTDTITGIYYCNGPTISGRGIDFFAEDPMTPAVSDFRFNIVMNPNGQNVILVTEDYCFYQNFSPLHGCSMAQTPPYTLGSSSYSLISTYIKPEMDSSYNTYYRK